jgi:hypothetical protein
MPTHPEAKPFIRRATTPLGLVFRRRGDVAVAVYALEKTTA